LSFNGGKPAQPTNQFSHAAPVGISIAIEPKNAFSLWHSFSLRKFAIYLDAKRLAPS